MGAGETQRIPSSNAFFYVDGQMVCDGVPLRQLAANLSTPFYVYSARAIEGAYRGIEASLAGIPHLIAYAMKANSNLAIASRLGALGAGADIVSGGELMRALEAGIPPSRIVFSGVAKSDEEIRFALGRGVRALNVESGSEIEGIGAIAASMGLRAPIALRINPDVDPKTHPYIATGLRHAKFGLGLDQARALLPKILGTSSLSLEGIGCHIGSQIASPSAVEDAAAIVGAFARECRDAGAPIRAIDAGGGWPIDYGDHASTPPSLEVFGGAIRAGMRRAGVEGFELVVEPGRSLVGDAGVLVTRVVHVKETGEKRFVIVDAAMTELMRPALYGAYHAIVPCEQRDHEHAWPCDVVGPVCESGDFLAKDRALVGVQRGDLLIVRGAGAYAASMGSRYNSRPLCAEVLVEDGRARLIRSRETFEDLLRRENARGEELPLQREPPR